MGEQRTVQDLSAHPCADAEQRPQMGQGEAAAGALAGGLAEVLAELKDAWHRAAAAVHDEEPMPAPGAGVIGHGVHRVGDAAEQCLEQGQGEPGAGLK